MPSTYTTNLGIEKIATGEQSGTWGNTTNTNLDILDQSIDGIISITLVSAGSSGSPNSLPITDGAVSNGRNKFIEFVDGGDLGATAYVQLTPNDSEKIVHIRNSLSASRSIIVFQGTYSASNDYEILNGEDVLLKFDGAGAGAVVSQVFANLALPSVNIDGGTIDGVTIGGGTIDGAVIGGATAAAGSFTTLSASSPISAADGSNSAPAITNTGDTDTGLYFSADNEISTATAGEQRIILDSSGVLKPREASTYGGAGAVIQGAVVFACEMPYVASVADNTWVQISMSTPTYENKAIVDGTTTGNAITIKKAGKYMMVWNGTLGGGSSFGNGTYFVRAYVEKNSVTFGGGTQLFAQGASENGTPAGNGLTQYASSARGVVVSGIESLSVSDVIRFWQLHDHSGGGYANPGNVMLIYFDE